MMRTRAMRKELPHGSPRAARKTRERDWNERMNGTVRLTVAGKDTECWIFVFSGPAA